jgi:CheY-like chemotaxis protein
VVGQWADGSVAVDDLSALDPDIVLMDIELPGASGIEVTRRIRQSRPDLRVVILTAFADANLLFVATAALQVVMVYFLFVTYERGGMAAFVGASVCTLFLHDILMRLNDVRVESERQRRQVVRM